ncbi:MAG: hypothetical protein ACFE9L_16785, partial [Candidatus Hodarchaeota archaeon]
NNLLKSVISFTCYNIFPFRKEYLELYLRHIKKNCVANFKETILMIIYAVFVINEQGKTTLSEKFQSADNIADEVFLGDLITSIQAVTKEMTKSDGELKSI